MISHELKFIFIHIPKTSGNSLSLFLKDFISNQVIQRKSLMGENQGIDIICEINNVDIKHKNIKYYNNLYNDRIKDYFKFTIVRNPYDRMLSFYFWSKGKNNQQFDKDEFINFIKNNNSYQYKFISNDFYIVHYENLINDLKDIKLFKNIYNFNDYPNLNSSLNSKFKYESIYDDELKKLVYNKFKIDFETFGYEH